MSNNRNEGLNDYYESLTGFDQKIYFANEIHRRKHVGVKMVDDEQLVKLASCKRGQHKYLIGEFNYNILNNEDYAEKFSYTTVDKRSPAEA